MSARVARVVDILGSMAELMDLCEWPEKAEWLRAERKKLEARPARGPAPRRTLRRLQGSLFGMGSFTDAPFMLKRRLGVTPRQAAERGLHLAAELDRVIEEILESGPGAGAAARAGARKRSARTRPRSQSNRGRKR